MPPKRKGAALDVPDSLPPEDRGADVSPDAVGRTERPRREPPDSVPADEEDNVERQRP